MSVAQTEARAIAEWLMLPDEDVFDLAVDAIATALAAKDAELAIAAEEIERLKNLVGDPEGTADHAEAFLARAERAEAALAEANKALEPFAAWITAVENAPNVIFGGDAAIVADPDGANIRLTSEHFRAARRAREAQGGE